MTNYLKISSSQRRQKGISLITVLIILLLSLTAVTGAFRVANLNEILVGNTSDYNRTYAAAEALMRDAEIDIRGRIPPYTTIQPVSGSLGFPCVPDGVNPLNTAAGFKGCRNRALANTPWFPGNASTELENVDAIIATNSPAWRCFQGICTPLALNALLNFENTPANLAAMLPLGSSYGQYTRNGLAAVGVSGNPALLNPGSRYWVEIFRHNGSNNGNLTPQPSLPLIYRITVVAQGAKAGTRVVMRSFFVPYPANQDI